MKNDKESVEKFINEMNNWFMNRERELNRKTIAMGHKFNGFVSLDQILKLGIDDQNLLTEFRALYVYKDAYFKRVDEMERQLKEGEEIINNLEGLKAGYISKASGND